MANRISHMESCLHCGTTTSSAMGSNDKTEKLLSRMVVLAVRASDVKALHEIATGALDKCGVFSTAGSVCHGPSSLYKLRLMRIAVNALNAAVGMLEPVANDIHEFDSNGHKI